MTKTNIVTIGGGTGSYTVLSGLKNNRNFSLSALVSMSDNGGSTGVLRDELGVLPPGDIRQCLVALSDHSDIVRNLMNYRFTDGTLLGHNFGNIFIAALEKVTGDFVKGVEIASEILKVHGKVIPITRDEAELLVELSDGRLIEGQVNITDADLQASEVKKIYYKNSVRLNEHAKLAVKNADYIIIGPGDYYCSVVPNLIVSGFKEAIQKSKAKIILPVNLTNKNGHTLHWNVGDYVSGVEGYLGRAIDYILVNNKAPSSEQIERYKLQEGDGVLVKDDLKDERVIRKSLISHLFFSSSNTDLVKRSFIRHDSLKLADCIGNLIQKNKNKYIFDFDDVIFNNTNKLKKRIFSYLEKNGVSHVIAEEYYKKVREKEFSLIDFISYLLAKEKIKKISAPDLYEEIMCKCADYLNREVVEIISKLGKSNCYLVTNGGKDFQQDKIKRSGVASLFDSVHIVKGSKKKIIEGICKENKNASVYFIDDKIKYFDDLDTKKFENLNTILFDKNGLKKLISSVNK